GRMHADDVLVLGPHGHHRLQVGALERLVESVLCILGGGKYFRAHCRDFISSSTRSTERSFMHLKWPSGQTRWKQGLQSTFSQTTRAAVDRGGVCSGLDEPNRATWRVPVAAATCIRPESLVTTA